MTIYQKVCKKRGQRYYKINTHTQSRIYGTHWNATRLLWYQALASIPSIVYLKKTSNTDSIVTAKPENTHWPVHRKTRRPGTSFPAWYLSHSGTASADDRWSPVHSIGSHISWKSQQMIVTCTQHKESHIMEQSAHDSHLYTAQEVTYHGTVSKW